MFAKRLLLLSALTAFSAMPAFARPVSYPEGWTAMLRNNQFNNSVHVHYTTDTRHSIGLRMRYQRDADTLFTGVQFNRLIKRWNNPDSQANVYGRFALGHVSDESTLNRDSDRGVFLGASADWETRRWFVEGAYEYWDFGRFGLERTYHGRVGVAPYIANTGALHTWFMVETHYRPDRNPLDGDKGGATALVRFFKGPHLVEIGVDNEAEPMLNYIYRY